MALPVTIKFRCTNKNIMSPTPPPSGTTEMVSAAFQLVPDAFNTYTGNMNLTYTLANDQFKIGDHIDATIAAGVAPAATAQNPRTP
jgi:hypothetical protein